MRPTQRDSNQLTPRASGLAGTVRGRVAVLVSRCRFRVRRYAAFYYAVGTLIAVFGLGVAAAPYTGRAPRRPSWWRRRRGVANTTSGRPRRQSHRGRASCLRFRHATGSLGRRRRAQHSAVVSEQCRSSRSTRRWAIGNGPESGGAHHLAWWQDQGHLVRPTTRAGYPPATDPRRAAGIDSPRR